MLSFKSLDVDSARERETHRETQRERHTERERDRETQRERERERERQRQTETETETEAITHRVVIVESYILLDYLFIRTIALPAGSRLDMSVFKPQRSTDRRIRD